MTSDCVRIRSAGLAKRRGSVRPMTVGLREALGRAERSYRSSRHARVCVEVCRSTRPHSCMRKQHHPHHASHMIVVILVIFVWSARGKSSSMSYTANARDCQHDIVVVPKQSCAHLGGRAIKTRTNH